MVLSLAGLPINKWKTKMGNYDILILYANKNCDVIASSTQKQNSLLKPDRHWD